MTFWTIRAAGLAAATLLALAGCVQNKAPPPKPGPTPAEIAARQAAEAAATEQAAKDAKVAQALRIAEEAYLYGYPLVTSEVLRLQMSNVAKPAGTRAPANTFWHARRLAPAGEKHVLVTDADTLASFAWLDLGAQAMQVSHPDMGKRWFSVGVHSQWMQALDTLGSRNGGGKAASVLISGPGWQGQVPKGLRHVRSATRHVAVMVRIQANSAEADQRSVNALQSRWRIAPLSTRGKAAAAAAPAPVLEPSPGFSVSDTPRQAIAAMDTASYFNLLMRLLGGAAPAAAQDAAMLEKMARIGLEPGKAFDMAALDPAVQAELQDTGKRAMAKIVAARPGLFISVNGWQLPATHGVPGTDDLKRAAVAAFDWPGAMPQDVFEATTRVDAAGKPLNGASDYTLSFAKGQMPPVDAFWSITLYTEDNGRRGFVSDSADTFSLGTRDKLLLNADGSLTLQVQNLSPGYERAANWLPAPKGDFSLTLRLYAPRAASPSALPPGQGSWAVPAVRRAD